jgi:uncharacterized protein
MTPERLDRLEAWLHAPEREEKTLPLDMLQGMFCAVVSAPSSIPPSKWLPVATGDVDLGAEAEEITALLMEFHNDVAQQLNEGDGFDFILYGDEEGEGDSLDVWCDGYLLGVDLADPPWDEKASPEEVDEMLLPFIALSRHLNDEEGRTVPGPEEERIYLSRLREALPDQIMDNRLFWFEQQIPDPIRRESPKVGRNDPCPCGSGKKYKACCGSPVRH